MPSLVRAASTAARARSRVSPSGASRRNSRTAPPPAAPAVPARPARPGDRGERRYRLRVLGGEDREGAHPLLVGGRGVFEDGLQPGPGLARPEEVERAQEQPLIAGPEPALLESAA